MYKNIYLKVFNHKLKLNIGICSTTKVYAVASMACKTLPIMYGFIDNFSLETTLKIWSITENPPNPSKNELSKIFVEIALTWIPLSSI